MRRTIEINQLRCFVAVAETLNFTRAAKRLNMTQPPLSRHIKLLEHAIGVKLFERNNKTVCLTLGGESLFFSAQDILQRSEHAVLKAQQAARGEAGSIVMGFVPSAGVDVVPSIAETLAIKFPYIQFRPMEMMSYEIVEALRSSIVDFGLTRAPSEDGSVKSIEIINEPFHLAIYKTHPLAVAPNVKVSDISGTSFVGYSSDRGGFLRNLHDTLFISEGIAPKIKLEVSQTQTMLAMVNQGIGIALVPSSARKLQMANLVYREVDIDPRFNPRIYLSYNTARDSLMHDRVARCICDIFEKSY
ncbi:LysR substrate-binding domain-containing protein [Roseobacter sp. HKCCD7870]|uniref:LysR substrate-binding domain-containing protein n=1 Tax=Roseobacter sp. HKCCD7870 TaxID=3120343 RepID=UPI0030EEAA09